MYVVSEKEKMGIGYRVNVFRNVVCPSAKNCAKMSKEDFVREGCGRSDRMQKSD